MPTCLPTALLLLIAALSAESCMQGYEMTYGGRCTRYDAYNSGSTSMFNTLFAHCAAEGTTFPLIKNANDNARLQTYVNTFTSGYYVTLGIVCDDATKKLTWQDGTAVVYANFANSTNMNCNSTTPRYQMDPVTGKWIPLNGQYAYFYCQEGYHNSNTEICGDFDPVVISGQSQVKYCYQMNKYAETWNTAYARCTARDTTLISIHDKDTNDFFRRQAIGLKFMDGVHIGIYEPSNLKNNTFIWADNTTFNYNNFARGFPDDSFGQCSSLTTVSTSGFWNTELCSTTLPYVCGRLPMDLKQQANTTCPDDYIFFNGEHIYSPGYPTTSPKGKSCEYMLNVTQGKKAAFEIVDFQSNYNSDILSILDGSSGTTVYSRISGAGIRNGAIYSAKSNTIRLIWNVTDGVNVRGWHIIVRAL